MIKTQLHEIHGKNRFCGPSAMSAVLGISTDHAAAVARQVSGKTSIKGLHTHHLQAAFKALGCTVRRVTLDKATAPTITQWLKTNRGMFAGRHVVVVAGNHFGTVLASKYLCRLSKGTVPFTSLPKARARVTGYLIIDKLPATTPAAPAPKKAPAGRRQVLALATRHGVDVEREDEESSIWVYPPSEFPVSDDPYESDGHYCDDWDDAMERVQTYVKLIQEKVKPS